jgi:geranylgeranyl pyrophosphate synthase
MDFRIRARKAKLLADRKARDRLSSLNYSKDVIQAFNLVDTSNSASETISIGIVLMDIAWQISGNDPSENELAGAFFPIHCFFLGTAYQDDLLDSQGMDSPRALVEKLGMPTCLIMGNILYCEALLSLIEVAENGDDNTIHWLLDSAEKLVRHVMESEIYRRKHIGKILPLKEFFRVWRRLTPNRACIEIGGILGNSDKKKVQILAEIGSNISLASRIVKEISEMYGLKGSLKEKLRSKPPPLPVTLAFESATPPEKSELERALNRLKSLEFHTMQTGNVSKDIEILIAIVAKYDSISAALKIHRDIIEETRELITQVSNSEHRDVLNRLLGSEFLPRHVS